MTGRTSETSLREHSAEGEREADASASDRHKEPSKLLKSIPPTESSCSNTLCPAVQ